MNAIPTPAHPLPHRVSEIFDPARWREVPGFTHAEPGTQAAEAPQVSTRSEERRVGKV